MNDILPNKPFSETDVQRVVGAMLELEQSDCPVTHHFGPGVYIREVTLQTDTVVIGHSHRNAHLNVMLTGRLTMINLDGTRRELVAPQTLMSQPGRKIAIIHEQVRWQNVYATDETDLEKLEEILFDKADADMLALAQQQLLIATDHHSDNEDYKAAVEGFEDHNWLGADDVYAGYPWGSYGVMIGKSSIHGTGLFAVSSFAPGDRIAPAVIGGLRTTAGRYTNHSAHPNAMMVAVSEGGELVALREISGSKGGSLGEEITLDYRQILGGR